MALYEDGSYVCSQCTSLIAKVLAGECSMNYTRVAVGSGEITQGEDPTTMTEPAGYVMDGKIADITSPTNGRCQVTVQIDSADVDTGFYATGLLLYAEDPDEGEIPYTYLVLENTPEWIKPSDSAVGKLATFYILVAVGDVETVTAVIDPDALVTRTTVEEIIAEQAKTDAGTYATYGYTRKFMEWVGSTLLNATITVCLERTYEDAVPDSITFGQSEYPLNPEDGDVVLVWVNDKILTQNLGSKYPVMVDTYGIDTETVSLLWYLKLYETYDPGSTVVVEIWNIPTTTTSTSTSTSGTATAVTEGTTVSVGGTDTATTTGTTASVYGVAEEVTDEDSNDSSDNTE